MKRIAFYYTNRNFANRDCSSLSAGNPGIGGTFFAMLQVINGLGEFNLKDFELYLFAEEKQKLPSNLNVILTPSVDILAQKLIAKKIDILVVNKIGANTCTNSFFNKLRNTNVDIFVWCHCFVTNKGLNILSKEPLVKKIVAVSKTQYKTWYDHKIFKKATYIYNICDFANPERVPFELRDSDVVYVGAINSIKGVHYLTEAWNYVLSYFPHSNLYIIGSGMLYGTSTKMGKFGIAERFYEKRLLKPILKDGKIIPSVHFCDILGGEKWKYLNSCKVGVVNAASWETFGYTMIEMQLAGLLVASYKSPGLIDTMYPNDGILYDSPRKLGASIVKLLNVKSHNDEDGIEYINNNFSKDIVLRRWCQLFQGVDLSLSELDACNFNYLKIVNINKKIKKYIPFLPSIILYRDCWLLMKKIIVLLGESGKVFSKVLNLIK